MTHPIMYNETYVNDLMTFTSPYRTKDSLLLTPDTGDSYCDKENELSKSTKVVRHKKLIKGVLKPRIIDPNERLEGWRIAKQPSTEKKHKHLLGEFDINMEIEALEKNLKLKKLPL